jgi:hypothetical protein
VVLEVLTVITEPVVPLVMLAPLQARLPLLQPVAVNDAT